GGVVVDSPRPGVVRWLCAAARGCARTKLPLPRTERIRPSARRCPRDSRMTVRLTEKRSMRADSLGRRAPGDSAPERISERSAAVTVVDRFEAMMPVSQFECVSTDGDRFRGPLARLFAERDAQPWAVRNDHATIGDLHPLVEEGIEPVEVLHPCLTRIAGGQVRMDLHGEVRGYIECGFVRKGEQAQKLADPTYARRVRLKDVTGSASDEAPMIGH